MLNWIATHPYIAAAVGILALYAAVCIRIVYTGVAARWLREYRGEFAAPSEESGAVEGANPTVRMPRFR